MNNTMVSTIDQVRKALPDVKRGIRDGMNTSLLMMG